MAEGLVSGQRFAADARLIEADAKKQNSTSDEDWDQSAIDPSQAPRAVTEYLGVLDDAAFGAASEVEPKFTSHSEPPRFYRRVKLSKDEPYDTTQTHPVLHG
jgi:hypothetical protein